MENIKEIHDFTQDIKHNMYSKKSSKLILSNEALLFQPNRILSNNIIRIPREDIQDFRYGLKWLRGFQLVIGREYQLFIRYKNGQELSIRMRTYYGYKRNQLHQQYSTLVDHLWSVYFRNMAQNYLNQYLEGKDFRICDVLISSNGINIESGGSFKRNRTFIQWDQVGSRSYQTSYSLFSKENAADINRGYYYLTDWNAAVLRAVIESILKIRNQE